MYVDEIHIYSKFEGLFQKLRRRRLLLCHNTKTGLHNDVESGCFICIVYRKSGYDLAQIEGDGEQLVGQRLVGFHHFLGDDDVGSEFVGILLTVS